MLPDKGAVSRMKHSRHGAEGSRSGDLCVTGEILSVICFRRITCREEIMRSRDQVCGQVRVRPWSFLIIQCVKCQVLVPTFVNSSTRMSGFRLRP